MQCQYPTTCPANSELGPYYNVCTCNAGYGASNDNQCISQSAGKDTGEPSCPLSKNNPVNAGTGDKFQREVVYAGPGPFPLRYEVSYTSRRSGSDYPLEASHGRYWLGNYERRLWPDASATATNGSGFVSFRRPDGKLLGHRLGNGSYRPDPDVTDRLVRLASATGATTGWQLTRPQGDEVETYDAAGKLLSIANRAGLTQKLDYDPQGRLSRITDPFGRALTLAYDGQNRVSTLTQPDGGVLTFDYDSADNLVSIAWPDGQTRRYHYENAAFPNNLTGLTDENGVRYATWSYDADGRVVSGQHAGGANADTFSYDTGSTRITDALGTVRLLKHSTVLSVVRSRGESQPGGSGCGPSSSGLTYDTNGNVASRTDYNGHVTAYSYDLTRNLETQRIEASGTPDARTISTEWHATYRLPLKVAEPGKLTTYTYDSTGNLLGRTEQATNDTNGSLGFSPELILTGLPRTWTWTYDTAGQALTTDGPRTDVADLTTFTYYPASDPDAGKRGLLASVTNALGHLTRITAYDANGRPLTVLDPNGVATTLAYDARGRLTGKNVGGEPTAYEYDGVGQLTRLTLPDGASLSYAYDPAHRLIGIADALGNQIQYTLDPLGNRTREEVKDPAGQLARTLNRVYDALNRLHLAIGAQAQVTEYAYDANGNLTQVSDPLQRETLSAYDALNRLIQVVDPANGQTSYAYDGQGQLVQVTDPRRLVTSYSVDGLGNQSTLTSPDSGVTHSTHDAAGNLLTRTDAKGQTTAWQYDALNRVTLVTYADGQQVRTVWDDAPLGIGRPSRIEELAAGAVSATTHYAYDALGRIVSETRSEGSLRLTTAYTYANGKLVALTYPSGKRLDYSHDAMGRIRQIQLSGNGQTKLIASHIEYQPFGGVRRWRNGAGQTQERSTDQDGRIVGYTLGSDSWQIGYDAAGRIRSQSDQGANSASYGYDRIARLIDAVLPFASFAYTYDANGNRSSQTGSSGTQTYQIGADSNRLLGVGWTTYSLDANGSLTSDGQRQFAYDARGRLVQATVAGTVGRQGGDRAGSGGHTAGAGRRPANPRAVEARGWESPPTPFASTTRYRIDALGRRVAKTNADEDTRYTYDRDGHLIAESDALGSSRREYIWLGDMPVALSAQAAVYYLHTDHLNTPRLVTDEANQVVWRHLPTSEPFGSSEPEEDPAQTGQRFELPLAFPGQYRDRETGLSQNYFRDCYDPLTGRYVQSDPIGLKGGINTYTYVKGNPITYIDPTGLAGCRWFGVVLVCDTGQPPVAGSSGNADIDAALGNGSSSAAASGSSSQDCEQRCEEDKAARDALCFIARAAGGKGAQRICLERSMDMYASCLKKCGQCGK